MPRFLIMDMNNLTMRACHVIKDTPDHRERMGRAHTIIFHSLARMANMFLADHCVACFDSHSWREEIYQIYKENRKLNPLTQADKIETKKISHIILREFVNYLRDKTNITVLEADRIEADDFIARWIQRHQDRSDTHIIVSNDGDFKQLVAPGIDLYDPIPGILYTSDGVYYKDEIRDLQHPAITRYGEIWKIKYSQPKVTLQYRYHADTNSNKESIEYPITPYPRVEGIEICDFTKSTDIIDLVRIIGENEGWEYHSANSGWMTFPVLSESAPLILFPNDRIRFIQHRETFDPKWELFLKCIRGDIRDNIKPAFLRVPATRIRKAYLDKEEYVKLINDTFSKDGEQVEVRPLFEMNKMLIDLTAQPTDIIASMDEVIDDMIDQEPKEMVEVYFNNFCTNTKNRRLLDIKNLVIPILSQPYPNMRST